MTYSAETWITLAVLTVAVLGLVSRRFSRQGPAGSFMAACIALAFAAAGYLMFQANTVLLMWPVLAAALVSLVSRKHEGIAAFAHLAGALVASVIASGVFFPARSSALTYPLVIASLALVSGFPILNQIYNAPLPFWPVLFTAIAALPVTEWFFISGWQAVYIAALAGFLGIVVLEHRRTHPSHMHFSRALVAAAALSAAAALVGGLYGIFVAVTAMLFLHAALKTDSKERSIVASSFAACLMVISGAVTFYKTESLLDYREPAILLFLGALLVITHGIKLYFSKHEL